MDDAEREKLREKMRKEFKKNVEQHEESLKLLGAHEA